MVTRNEIKRVVFLLFAISTCFAQKNTIYLNENNIEISSKKHFDKVNTSIYHSFTYELDTVVYKKLRFSHFFGKLEKDRKQFFCEKLYKKFKIDTTKNIIFHYLDTIRKKDIPHKKDSVYFSRKMKHVIKRTTCLNLHEKCNKTYKKCKNTTLLHFYNTTDSKKNNIYGIDWLNDDFHFVRDFIKDKYFSFDCFVLRPNGEFFLQNRRDTKVIDLIKIINSKWDVYAKDFRKRYNSLNKNY